MFGKENKKTNKKISLYLSFAIIGLFFMYEIFCGVRIFIAKANMISIDCSSGFAVQKGDYIEGNVMCATKEYVEVKHSVNFIPTGKEHYYLLISKDLKSCISIRADKEWYDEHFIKSAAIDPAGIKVKGYVKKMDYKVQKKMQEVVNDYSNKGVTVTGNYDVYIDACADRYAFMDIVIGVIPCLMAVWFLYIVRKKDRITDKNLQKPTVINIKGILWIVGTLIYIIVFIHALSMK